jgi:hypothetical protein
VDDIVEQIFFFEEPVRRRRNLENLRCRRVQVKYAM